MYIYKFDESEVIVNTLTVYPSHDMYLYEQGVYIDRRPELSGAYANNVTMVSSSDISLFELNVTGILGTKYHSQTKPTPRPLGEQKAQ